MFFVTVILLLSAGLFHTGQCCGIKFYYCSCSVMEKKKTQENKAKLDSLWKNFRWEMWKKNGVFNLFAGIVMNDSDHPNKRRKFDIKVNIANHLDLDLLSYEFLFLFIFLYVGFVYHLTFKIFSKLLNCSFFSFAVCYQIRCKIIMHRMGPPFLFHWNMSTNMLIWARFQVSLYQLTISR